MKSYNEMAKSALLRIEEENKIILKRKKALKRTLIPALSLCLAVAVSFAVKDVWNNKSGVEIEEEEYVLYEYENAIGTDGNNMTGIKTEATTGNSAKPDNSNGNPQTTVQGSYIWPFDVIYDGKTYIQAENKKASDYETETLLGDAKDFSSYCKVANMNGKLYTVKDNSDLLIVELEDGKRFLFKEVD